MLLLKGIPARRSGENHALRFPLPELNKLIEIELASHYKAKRKWEALGICQQKAKLHCYCSVMRVFCAATNCQAPFIFTNVKVTRY